MKTLKQVGVLGAGTSGKGIIRALAGSGLNVIFCELTERKVREALVDIEHGLEQEISRWGVTDGEKRLIMSRIRGTMDIRELSGSQMIIEAVSGELDRKIEIYEELDRTFPSEVIFVSNSATIRVSDLTRRMTHADRVVGIHFSHPIARRKIVEVVRGIDTNEEAMESANLLAKLLKKEVLNVFESPGLITVRVMMPYVNEAMYLVMEGLASPEEVDKAVRLGFRLPIGPLALADRLGLDSLLRDSERLFKQLGEPKFRPCPLLRRMVREGHLGVKTRRGFFVYDEQGRKIGTPADRL